MSEKMMTSLVKVTHAALAENRDPKAGAHKYMAFVRAMPHGSTEKAPRKLLMGRRLKLKIPGLLGKFDSEVHTEAKAADLKHKKGRHMRMCTEEPRRRSQRSEREEEGATGGARERTGGREDVHKVRQGGEAIGEAGDGAGPAQSKEQEEEHD